MRGHVEPKNYALADNRENSEILGRPISHEE